MPGTERKLTVGIVSIGMKDRNGNSEDGRFLNRSGYLCWDINFSIIHMNVQRSWNKYYSNTFQCETSLQPISYRRLTLDGTLLSSTSLANIKSAYASLKHSSNTDQCIPISNTLFSTHISLTFLVSCLASWVGYHVCKLLQRLLFHPEHDIVILISKHPLPWIHDTEADSELCIMTIIIKQTPQYTLFDSESLSDVTNSEEACT